MPSIQTEERETHLEPQQHRNPVDRDWDWIGEMEASWGNPFPDAKPKGGRDAAWQPDGSHGLSPIATRRGTQCYGWGEY